MAFLKETKITRHPHKSISRKLMIAVRIRHLQNEETSRSVVNINDQVVVLKENEADKNDVLRHNRGGECQYVFDVVFGEDAPQEIVFEKTTKGLVKDVLEGFNATIFAYGASGSGKTHTMLGNTEQPGIMIRALNEIFNEIKNKPFFQQFHVTMSYLEIYNENIRDLLNPNSGFLELREDQKEKIIEVVKLSEVSTNSTEDMMKLLQKGNKARTMEPTAQNKTSSRSHALLSIIVRQTLPSENGDALNATVKQGKLFMIDLAGSERASQTKNQGKRLIEGAHINRSLLALGNCINALSGGARYVNYRDSKLTRLLKDALSGNSQTCMIAHVSPAALHREESKNTLVYAYRAKNITNKVEKNVLDISHQVSQYRTVISELRDEIVRLKSKIPKKKNISQENKVNISEKETSETFNHLSSSHSHLYALKNEIITTFREQMKLKKRLLSIENYLMELEIEADRQKSFIQGHEGRSTRVYRTLSGKMPEQPDLESLDLDYLDIDQDPLRSLERAMMELALIEKKQEKYSEMKAITETELENCKEKAALLERELPYEINTEEEKELLTLLIRVYELEVEKIVFQSERLTREYALRRKDIAIERFNRQRQICEEIIIRQREVMEEENLPLPPDVLKLYQLYQQETKLYGYTDHNLNEVTSSINSGKLPPIVHGEMDNHSLRAHSFDNGLDDSDNSVWTPSSSAGSDWIPSPLPSITQRRFSSYSTNMPPTCVLFPPIIK